MLDEFEVKLQRLCKLFHIKYRTVEEEIKYQGTIQEFTEDSLQTLFKELEVYFIFQK